MSYPNLTNRIILLTSVLLVFFSIMLMGCSQHNNLDSITQARTMINESNTISYTLTEFAPIPETDMVSETKISTIYSRQPTDSLGINFIQTTVGGNIINKTVVYQNGELIIIDHKIRSVRTLLPSHFESPRAFRENVQQTFSNTWSPLNLLDQKWEFLADTLIANTMFANYFLIDREYTFEEKKGRIEHHIFINKNNSLMERSERRNYHNDSLRQRVTRLYSDYEFSNSKQELNFTLPQHYVSQFGEPVTEEPLKVGEPAPTFRAETIDGKAVNLEDFKSRKILLNFSVINCGYCMQALNHFNQNDFELRPDIEVLYINPEDDASALREFMNNKTIPFPVIANAESIGRKYKLNSYPRFFLINENGIIENIQIGYSKELIDGLRK